MTDYDLRGPDWDTSLCGPITESIIDADRLARFDYRGWVPAFFLYRAVYCQDSIYVPIIKRWLEELVGRVLSPVGRPTKARNELVRVMARDILQTLLEGRELVYADREHWLKYIEPATYYKIRNKLLNGIDGELRDYYGWLGAAYRATVLTNRRVA